MSDKHKGPYAYYAGATNWTVYGPCGLSVLVHDERYCWQYVEMLNNAYHAAQKDLLKRIAELERDMDAIATIYERDVDRCGSHEMVANAYGMRCIARSALLDAKKLKP